MMSLALNNWAQMFKTHLKILHVFIKIFKNYTEGIYSYYKLGTRNNYVKQSSGHQNKVSSCTSDLGRKDS